MTRCRKRVPCTHSTEATDVLPTNHSTEFFFEKVTTKTVEVMRFRRFRSSPEVNWAVWIGRVARMLVWWLVGPEQ